MDDEEKYKLWCDIDEFVKQGNVLDLKWIEKRMDENNNYASGLNSIGYGYSQDGKLKTNHKNEVYWYKKAVNNNNGWGFNNLGHCYEFGTGVEKDYDKALELYLKSINMGNDMAKSNMKKLLEKIDEDHLIDVLMNKIDLITVNKGTNKMNDGEKIKLLNDFDEFNKYRKTIKLDVIQDIINKAVSYSDAQNEIGRKFRKLEFGNTKYQNAMFWYNKAIDNDNGNALSNLGELYESGKGVEKDYDKALELYLKALKVKEKDHTRNRVKRLLKKIDEDHLIDILVSLQLNKTV